MIVTSSQKVKAEDLKFRVILSYISMRSAWDTTIFTKKKNLLKVKLLCFCFLKDKHLYRVLYKSEIINIHM